MGIISEYLCCSDESATIDTRSLPEFHGHGGSPFSPDASKKDELCVQALPIHRFGCNSWGKIMHYCTSFSLFWWDAIAKRVSKSVTLFFLCEDSDGRYFQIHLDPVAKRASWKAMDADQMPKRILHAPKKRPYRLSRPKRLRKVKQDRHARAMVKLGKFRVNTQWDHERWNGMPDVNPTRFRLALATIQNQFKSICENRQLMW